VLKVFAIFIKYWRPYTNSTFQPLGNMMLRFITNALQVPTLCSRTAKKRFIKKELAGSFKNKQALHLLLLNLVPQST
jgi:hypothetical protein